MSMGKWTIEKVYNLQKPLSHKRFENKFMAVKNETIAAVATYV